MEVVVYLDSSSPQELKCVIQIEGPVPPDLGKRIVSESQFAFDLVRNAAMTQGNTPDLVNLHLRLRGAEDARYWETTLQGEGVASDLHMALVITTFKVLLRRPGPSPLTTRYHLDEPPFNPDAVRAQIKQLETDIERLEIETRTARAEQVRAAMAHVQQESQAQQEQQPWQESPAPAASNQPPQDGQADAEPLLPGRGNGTPTPR